MKTLKMVSVFSFRHWKCHFRHTQNIEAHKRQMFSIFLRVVCARKKYFLRFLRHRLEGPPSSSIEIFHNVASVTIGICTALVSSCAM